MIRNRNVAIVLGLVLTAAGYVLLYQAFDGSGAKKPLVLGPFLPW